MQAEEYKAWLADCIRENVCTYHQVKNCGCYYWTGVKLEHGVDPNSGMKN